MITPYYEDDACQIYLGDCREIMPHVKADCFITDPPYGVGLKARVTKHSIRKGSYTLFDDSEDYVAGTVIPVIEMMIANCIRGAVTPGVRCLNLYPKAADIGTIWSPAGAGRSPWGFMCSHPILYYGKCPFLAKGKGSRPNGMQFTTAGEPSDHPCPKPLSVMTWLVDRVSLEGETILDPFMGSGTTLRAAKDLGRKAIGIEIEEKYAEIAARRLAQEVLL